jgi:hypothetical protein
VTNMLWSKPTAHTKYPWALAHWDVTPVGSRVTCSPRPMATDIDYLVLGNVRKSKKHLIAAGFHPEYRSKYNYNSIFYSLRYGNVNVIVTSSKRFQRKFLLATSIAKELNLLEKYHRVTLFQAILYDKFP